MEQDNTQTSLSASPYIQKIQGDKVTGRIYLVYDASGKSERVFAVTASEAISKSSIKDPIRVLQYNPLNQVLVGGEELTFDDVAAEVAEAAVDAAAQEEASSDGAEQAPEGGAEAN